MLFNVSLTPLQILIKIDTLEKSFGFVVWARVPSGMLQRAPRAWIQVPQFEKYVPWCTTRINSCRIVDVIKFMPLAKECCNNLNSNFTCFEQMNY